MSTIEKNQTFPDGAEDAPPVPEAPICLTKVTATRPKQLAKRYDFIDGKLVKSTQAAMSTGQIETLSLASPNELIKLLEELTHADALMFGRAIDANASRIMTRRMLLATPTEGTVARTKEAFQFPDGPAFFFLDLDGLADGRYLSEEEILDLLYRLCPALRGVQFLIFPSSSSHIIHTKTDEDLTGRRGVHVYIPVMEGYDIPRAGDVLKDKAWLAGDGYIAISKNGNCLFRTFFDTSVLQPSRLVFASGAICGEGLEQRRGKPRLINPDGARALDTIEALPPLNPADLNLAAAVRDHARAAKKAEAEAIRTEWLSNRRVLIRSLGGRMQAAETAETLIAAVEERKLGSEFILMVRRCGESAFKAKTVHEVLSDRLGYHRALTLDPIEPDYNGGAEVGILFLDGRQPTLHSMAHGGATFQLQVSRTMIDVFPGQRRDATQRVLDHMSQDTRFYNHAELLTTIRDGKRFTLDDYELEFLLGEGIRFQAPNSRGALVPTEVPLRVLGQLLRPSAVRQLRPLMAVLNHPTITGDGRLLDHPGYHADCQFFLDFNPDDWPTIQSDMSEAEARALVDTIWTPFCEFPFPDAAARGGVLAAVLTAILRASFETAPAFASFGPVVGAGKSMVLQTVIAIATGEKATVLPPFAEGDEAEVRKVLTSLVIGGKDCALFDNVEGTVDSPTLQAFLTSSQWSDRHLSTNLMLKDAPTRIFMALSGANLGFSSGLQRRMISWRVNPEMDHGAGRVFSWDPQTVALSKRTSIIAAALGLVLAAQKAQLPPVTASLGSFPVWERIVRTTLRFIERVTHGKFVDPVPNTLDAVQFNSETLAVHQLHTAIYDDFKLDTFTARCLLEKAVSLDGSALSDALSGATNRSEKLSSKSLGRYLQRYIDRPLWGLVLRAIRGQKSLAYRLEPHATAGQSGAQSLFELLAGRCNLPREFFGEVVLIDQRRCRIQEISMVDMSRGQFVAVDVGTGERHLLSVDQAHNALRDSRTSDA